MPLAKGIFFIAALFAVALLLMTQDPLNLNPEGINGEGWLIILYLLPVILIGFVVYKLVNKKS